MATQRPRRTAAATRPARRQPQQPPNHLRVRIKVEYIDINDIQEYENNARNNAEAVVAVRKSIRTFGFLNPIVLDDNNVLIAGHTRTEAAKQEGMNELPFVRASHLTPEQVAAFRLVDNKVAEIATWDDALLAQEIDILKDMFDFTDFGWEQAELDCLGQLVDDDCLATAGLVPAASEESGEESRLPVRRAPATTRIVIGDLVFFRPNADVRAFLDGLRRQHNADQAAIAEDICERLGLLSNTDS